jgi:hypothetical protein
MEHKIVKRPTLFYFYIYFNREASNPAASRQKRHKNFPALQLINGPQKAAFQEPWRPQNASSILFAPAEKGSVPGTLAAARDRPPQCLLREGGSQGAFTATSRPRCPAFPGQAVLQALYEPALFLRSLR